MEESFGYLKGTYARDKDAVVASMLICEVAAEYKQKCMTLYDALINFYRKYGFCAQKLESVTLKGIDGSAKIQKMMHKFYNHYKVYCYTMFVDADSSINAVKSAESMDKGYCLPSRIDDIAVFENEIKLCSKTSKAEEIHKDGINVPKSYNDAKLYLKAYALLGLVKFNEADEINFSIDCRKKSSIRFLNLT